MSEWVPRSSQLATNNLFFKLGQASFTTAQEAMAATAPLKKFPGAILIVSNGEFRYPITPLPSAQKDAESMRDFFGKTLNYQLVEMHVGLTANKFEICFKSFANKVKDPSLELAVVYLSSHGGRTSSPDQTFVCFKTTEL